MNVPILFLVRPPACVYEPDRGRPKLSRTYRPCAARLLPSSQNGSPTGPTTRVCWRRAGRPRSSSGQLAPGASPANDCEEAFVRRVAVDGLPGAPDLRPVFERCTVAAYEEATRRLTTSPTRHHTGCRATDDVGSVPNSTVRLCVAATDRHHSDAWPISRGRGRSEMARKAGRPSTYMRLRSVRRRRFRSHSPGNPSAI